MSFRSLTTSAFVLFITCGVSTTSAIGQRLPDRSDEVVRVNTDLVQTDVMVFDKQGNFVDGLKRDQFVLKIDGKARDISFFDRVAAGSRSEEAQIAAARGNPTAAGAKGPVPLDRGRTVIFFIDDYHLSPSSASQTRALLKRFIDHEMRQNDQGLITSASGQIGFLQQLTDNKKVLTAAADRLRSQSNVTQTGERPPMSEYQALLIDSRRDPDVLDFYVDYLVREDPMLPRETAAEMVRGRASALLHQAAAVTTNTLATLKGLIDRAAPLPGRKILFLVSDGFFIDVNNSDSLGRIRDTTSAAGRTGVVIYSIDARGLSAGLPDASAEQAVDSTGRLQRAAIGELSASRDGMNALAGDTGGRAFFNSNALSAAVTTGLKESSVYYLLAWRPESEEQRSSRYRRIEVGVLGHPDLVIRFRHGFGDLNSTDTAKKSKDSSAARKTPDEELSAALRAAYPQTNLFVSLTLNYLDDARLGGTLTASMKVSTNSLPLENTGGTPTAVLDVAGLVLNDQGKSVSTFNKRLTIKPGATNATAVPPENVFYNHLALIKPGLYQVRVAAVDEKQGNSGSASQWIEIPDLQSKILTLSSLIVGEKRAEPEPAPSEVGLDDAKKPAALAQVRLNVDHHFSRTSNLRFLTFIYNAAANSAAGSPSASPATVNTVPASTNASGPDLAVQVQIFRDNEPVVTMPLHRIQTDGQTDLQRLPYAAEVLLDSLPAGPYVLQVTVIDRLAKASASQKFSFQVD